MKITVPLVKAAAKKAYEEGRLIAQDPNMFECSYRVNGKVCAIGAALSDDVLDRLEQNGLIGVSIECTEIHEYFTWNRHDTHALRRIQLAHDDWWNINSFSQESTKADKLFLKEISDD